MKAFIKKYLAPEDGAVTVDWVVLTAGIVTVIVLSYNSMRGNTVDLANDIGSYMATR